VLALSANALFLTLALQANTCVSITLALSPLMLAKIRAMTVPRTAPITSNALITNVFRTQQTVLQRGDALLQLHTSAPMATATMLQSTRAEKPDAQSLYSALTTSLMSALMVNVLVTPHSARLNFLVLLAKLDATIEPALPL